MKFNIRGVLARIVSRFTRSKDSHEYEFSIGQRLVIATDLGRSGVVRGRRFDSLTNTEQYLIERRPSGSKEWYPRMSLCLSESEIREQPTSREIPLTPEQAAQFAARRPE